MSIVEVAGLPITWDENKNTINKRKHGISFQDAAKVFLDKFRLDDFDELHSDDEDRYITIGFVDDILTVVYTEREELTWIISARLANKAERKRYYAQY